MNLHLLRLLVVCTNRDTSGRLCTNTYLRKPITCGCNGSNIDRERICRMIYDLGNTRGRDLHAIHPCRRAPWLRKQHTCYLDRASFARSVRGLYRKTPVSCELIPFLGYPSNDAVVFLALYEDHAYFYCAREIFRHPHNTFGVLYRSDISCNKLANRPGDR